MDCFCILPEKWESISELVYGYSHVFEGDGLGLKFFADAETRSLVVI